MPKIIFVPEGVEVEVDFGETILQAAMKAGLSPAHTCGGRARCSTCRVRILEGEDRVSRPTAQEKAVIERMKFNPCVRLGCQTAVQGDLKVQMLVRGNEADTEVTSLYVVGAERGVSGVEKEIHIMFADIGGFTAFSENLLPYDVIHVLNHFFHSMGEVISRHGGHIDTYLGDGFMALFEGDNPREGAWEAVQAGLEMLEEIWRMQPYLQELFHKSFSIRIGLHFGDVVAGTVGAVGRKKTTVIGDAVNVASRIEDANKQLGTHFLISKDIYALVKEKILVGRCVSLRFPGKSGEFTLYEVNGLKPQGTSEDFPESRSTADTKTAGVAMAQRFPVIVKEDCIACGNCEAVCPEVFKLDETLGHSRVIDPYGAPEDKIQDAIDQCPAQCIHWNAGD